MSSIEPDVLAVDGGTPVRDAGQKPWPRWPIFDETEERALLEVLRSGEWWYVTGGNGKALETEFAALHKARFGVACTNGTAALEIALRALGIGCGDEVIVPPYTFIATATAVLAAGATPIFVDIQAETHNIDPTLIEAAITPRTRAVIPVHIAGRPADMDAVMEVARRHKLFVIEDAAQAHMAAWRGTPVGAIGDLGTFSMQASKNLNSGEGGLILSNNEEYADSAWSVMNVGRVRSGRWYEHHALGSNYRMTEFQAAIARAQLTRLEAQTALRAENAAYLRSLLLQVPGVLLPSEDPRITSHANHLFIFRYVAAEFGGRPFPDFLAALNAEGIPAGDGYVPLYKAPLFKRVAAREGKWCRAAQFVDYPNLHLPVCEAVCKDTVWLAQTLLLGTRADMDDIGTSLARIQRAWS